MSDPQTAEVTHEEALEAFSRALAREEDENMRLRADAQQIMAINNRLRETLLRVLAEEDLREVAQDYIKAVVS